MAMAVSYLFRGRSRVTKVPMWLSSSSSKSCVSKKSKVTCPVELLPMWLPSCPPNRVLLQGQRYYVQERSTTQSVYSVVAHLEQPRVGGYGFCVPRQNRWLTPCPWGGQPAFLARGACRALDSRA